VINKNHKILKWILLMYLSEVKDIPRTNLKDCCNKH
jgi:hypothetical protein